MRWKTSEMAICSSCNSLCSCSQHRGLQEPRDFPDQSPCFGFSQSLCNFPTTNLSSHFLKLCSCLAPTTSYSKQVCRLMALFPLSKTGSCLFGSQWPAATRYWYSVARSTAHLLQQISESGQQAMLPLSTNKVEWVEQHSAQLQPRQP